MKTHAAFCMFQRVLTLRFCLLLTLTLILSGYAGVGIAATLPYELVNNSEFPDDQIYVGLIGRTDAGGVWMDLKDSSIHAMQVSDNTIAGPQTTGNPGPGGDGMYADCFTPLSQIPNHTINLPEISSVRIYIAFGSRLYFYFFGNDGGYSAPDLNNPSDPNQGIRFEIIELTYNNIGLWTNTTRVDAYQYPMGLEVWGDNDFYRKVGEILTHKEVLTAWQARVPESFQGCYNPDLGIIHAPSKTPEFKEGGAMYTYFDDYVNLVWDRYMTEDLTMGIGDAGRWVGRVQADGETFRFTRPSDGRVAVIEARPNTQEILEGKGVLAHDVPQTPTADDLDVQKHFCAAFTRGAIDPDAPAGAVNDWSDEDDYFKNNVFSEYVKFWHHPDIRYEGRAYAFCYDDVFEYSSTIHTPQPTLARITIGGFAGTVPDDQNGDDQDTGDQNADDQNTDDQNADDQNADDRNADDRNMDDQNADDQNAVNQNTDDQNTEQPDEPAENLALGKAVTASSIEGVAFESSDAVDGSMETRWSSAHGVDPQWLQVDLGKEYAIDRIVIAWETAMAEDYEIQISTDGALWSTIRAITENAAALFDESGLAARARFIRIFGTARTTQYGYSIWELEVYGGAASDNATGGCDGFDTASSGCDIFDAVSSGCDDAATEDATDEEDLLSIPLHIEYAQYLRLGFSPADQNGLSELITQNTERETTLSYTAGTTFTISLIEKRREEDLRIYTYTNGNTAEIVEGVPLTVTAAPGMEIFVDFIEEDPDLLPPVGRAGDNRTIDLAQTDCVALDGASSFDPDGDVVSYQWTQVSGPNTLPSADPNAVGIEYCGLVEGLYQFQLTVTDNDGLTGTDVVQITAKSDQADFSLQSPADGSLIAATRRPQFSWNSVAGTVRYDIYLNVTKENYDWYASGNLLDRYTLVGQSTTNSFTMPDDLVDRWTYKWYVTAIDGSGNASVSNTQQFGLYLPELEQEDDGVGIVDGCRDMNKNGTIEPFENWKLPPEERLNDLMARLPTEEKFKQSFYGAGSDAKDGFAFSYGVEHIMRNEQIAAAATPWGIPVAHAGDKIHGWKTIYPTQLGLAATRDPNIAYQCGDMQRREHKSFGFAGTLMPLAEVDTKVLYPRFQEGNGENADEASAIIRAMVCGMQGGPEVNPHSMLVTVKHWPGQGAGGEGPTQYDERTIGYHMKPWYAMVEANAASVMPGYSSSPLLDPAGGGSNSSKPIIDYLRNVIGFEGFVVTDWLAATTAQSIESMSAGIDVLGGAPSSGTDVNQLVAAIGMDRLNEACRRVLNTKIRLGMFENPYGDPAASWTNADHHAIALTAARKSITLIKNDGILPLRLTAGATLSVAGPRAVWANQDADPNVIWQSIYYDNPQAVNYVEAFQNRASSNGVSVTNSGSTAADAAVVVIGEQSYTHGTEWSDKDPDIPAEQLSVIENFRNRGIPVITVVISPRPYVLTRVRDLSNAVMLVYRGGNGIAQATAELCFGDYMPTGKLPFQLPRSQDQIGTDNPADQIEHWELPYDLGATAAEREEIIYYMENNLPIPTDFGDPLYPYGWGLQNWNISLTKAQN